MIRPEIELVAHDSISRFDIIKRGEYIRKQINIALSESDPYISHALLDGLAIPVVIKIRGSKEKFTYRGNGPTPSIFLILTITDRESRYKIFTDKDSLFLSSSK